MAPTAQTKRVRYCCGFPKKSHACHFADGSSSAPADLAGAKKEEEDHITTLPNDVLGTIISALPTEEAARTNAISKEWKHLWRKSTPLNIADHNLVVLISEILEAPCKVRVHRLSLSMLCHHFGGRDRYPIFGGWFRPKVHDHLEVFHFSYQRSMLPLPPSTLSFSFLCVASFGYCHFPEDPHLVGAITFSDIIDLTLFRITHTEDTLHAMIAASPNLMTLYLNRCYHFRYVHINSQTLVSFTMLVDQDCDRMEVLIIVNTPSLQQLVLCDGGYYGPRIIRVLVAPKLHTLSWMHSDMMSTLHLGKTILQAMVDSSLVSSPHNVKILMLILHGLRLNHVIDVLQCFLCLQQLHINTLTAATTLECVDGHLKLVVVRNYSGKKPDYNFATFFLLNARVLESMKLHVPFSWNNEWRSRQRMKMDFKNRASPNGLVYFEGTE
ncbi:hypothetical protein VPH35_026583 [Triticum aestivum]